MASRPVSLVQAVASVYNLHPQLSPGDSLFGEFMEQLRRYPERLPNLLLVDLKLPGVSGFQLLEWVRLQPVGEA